MPRYTLVPPLDGSSPRVRGTRDAGVALRRRARFIPACAGNSCRDLRSSLISAVHPRVCGVSRWSCCRGLSFGGSSPRVRGTRGSRCWRCAGGRFIPACAGNSCAAFLAKLGAPVHPRVCGELVEHERLLPAVHRFIPACAGNSSTIGRGRRRVHGSSPRVRGTRSGPDAAEEHGRFIPACAGNSAAGAVALGVLDGSSPRVRGTPSRCSGQSCNPRFIPACAGNSTQAHTDAQIRNGSSPRVRGTRWTRWPWASPSSVHPRVCGELEIGLVVAAAPARFIPACAGNSMSPSALPAAVFGSSPRVRGTRAAGGGDWSDSVAVHPRVCGELRELGAPDHRRRRFIPACAGNSTATFAGLSIADGSSPRVRGTRRSRAAASRRSTVHPRVCGELLDAVTGAGVTDGSSPRVRGTRAGRRIGCRCAAVHPRVCGELGTDAQLVGVRVRFIPACAGNSRFSGSPFELQPVHPRVCGELAMRADGIDVELGSSPRVRGTRARARVEHSMDPGSSPRVRGTPTALAR